MLAVSRGGVQAVEQQATWPLASEGAGAARGAPVQALAVGWGGVRAPVRKACTADKDQA